MRRMAPPPRCDRNTQARPRRTQPTSPLIQDFPHSRFESRASALCGKVAPSCSRLSAVLPYLLLFEALQKGIARYFDEIVVFLGSAELSP